MGNAPKFSIVIVTYNSGRDIGPCLKSIEKNTRDFEAVVVDNASRDNTREELEKFPWANKILSNKNLGFSAGVNAGIRATTGDFVILLNPDTVVFPLWADRMADKFRKHPNVGAVGPLSTNCIGYQSVFNRLKYDFSGEFDINDVAEKVLLQNGQFEEQKLLIGFCLMVPREVFIHVGLLDERLFLGNDDLELSWRLRTHGYRLLLSKDAFVAHELQKSFRTEPKEKTDRLVQESADELYRKLARRYGKRNIPACTQLWGIEWFKPSAQALEEPIGGPERRLKILFAYNYSPDTLPERWEPALRMFNDVTTVGHSSVKERPMDIPLASKDADLVAAVEQNGGFGAYDVFIWFESSFFSLSERFLKIPIPTVGVFSASMVHLPLHSKAIRLFDHAVITEYNVFRLLKRQGVEGITHLYTNAFDETAIPEVKDPPLDVSFAGSYISYLYGGRGKALARLLSLSDRYRIFIGNNIYGEGYKKLIANSKIVINALADEQRSITMRAYETMGQGRLLLTSEPIDRCPYQEFRENVHFVTFRDETELETKIEYYLSHPEERRKIGEAAREAVLKRNTYRINAARLSAIIRELLSEKPPFEKRLKADMARDMAFIRLCCGEPAQALACLPLSEEPGRAEKEALLLYRTGKREEAIRALEGLGSRLGKAGAFSLGLVYLEKNDRAASRRYFEAALTLNLGSTDELIWCLPGGMSFERILNIRSGVKLLENEPEAAALSFADRALDADILCRLAHIAVMENDMAGAAKALARIDGEEVTYDKVHLLNALVAWGAGDRAACERHLALVRENDSLDVQNGLVMAGLYEKLGDTRMAVKSLLRGLDNIQIMCALDLTGPGDYAGLAAEYMQALARFNVPMPPAGDSFARTVRPADGSWAVRRYTGAPDLSPMDVMDLNLLDNPEEALKAEKRRQRPIQARFRNIQSLQCLEEMCGAGLSPRDNAGNERVREYTFVSAENLLSRAGYEITGVENVMLPAQYLSRMNEELVRAGRLVLKRLEYREDEWKRFFTGEFLVSARPRVFKDVSTKKVSIIILTFNQLDYTKKCVDSIAANTSGVPYELIVVDNASRDDTPAWLTAQREAGKIHKIVLNASNLGVAAGWNAGLKAAAQDTAYYLILNNDVVVPEGWLTNLVRCAESAPDIGMAGPMTNNVSGLQCEAGAKYTTLAEFFRYAKAYMSENTGNWWELFRIVGFCLLIKKETADAVGAFDERFGKGNFEDDDYCIRVRRSGRRIMVAGDCFIHHFGSVSFGGAASVDWTGQMIKNQKLFNDKWAQIDRETIEKRLKSGTGLLLAQAEKLIHGKEFGGAVQLLLSVIEKEPKNHLAYNHLGVAAWHMGNPADAEKFFLESLKWKGDYGDAVFNLADVYEARSDIAALRELLSAFLEKEPGNAEARARLDRTPSGAEKERHDAGFVEGVLKEAAASIRAGAYDDGVNLLSIILDKEPDHAEALNLTGICAWHKGRVEEAYWFFRKAVALRPSDEDTLFNFMDAALALGRPEEVVNAFEAALAVDPGLKEIAKNLEKIRMEQAASGDRLDFTRIIAARELNIRGEAYINEGLIDKAEAVFNEILSKDPGNFVAVNNLGVVQWYRGDVEAAFERFSQSAGLNPVYEDALVNLFDAALKLRKVERMIPLLEKALKLNPALRDAGEILHQVRLRGARIHEIGFYGQINPSIRLNLEGKKFLDELKLGEATLKFLDAIEKHGENCDSYCGLGIIQFYRREFQDAYDLFSRAVSLNPLSQDALLNLFDAAQQLGAVETVRPLLQNALDMDPSLSGVRGALEEGLRPGTGGI